MSQEHSSESASNTQLISPSGEAGLDKCYLEPLQKKHVAAVNGLWVLDLGHYHLRNTAVIQGGVKPFIKPANCKLSAPRYSLCPEIAVSPI